MDLTALSEQNIFLFILPGFVTVWSFRYFTNSEKKADFEYLGLSFVWGIFNLMFFGLAVMIGLINDIPMNTSTPAFAFAPVFCIFGSFLGFIGAGISKLHWVRRAVNWLKK